MTKKEIMKGGMQLTVAVIAGCAVALFTASMTKKAHGSDKIYEAIKKKVDKTELNEYKRQHDVEEGTYRNEHEQRHNLEGEKVELIKDHIDKRIDDVIKLLK